MLILLFVNIWLAPIFPAQAAEFATHYRFRVTNSPQPTPLEERAHHWNFSYGDYHGVAWNYPKGLSRVLNDIQKQYGHIRCDCGTFVQIQALLGQDGPDLYKRILPLHINLPEVVACACQTRLVQFYLPGIDFWLRPIGPKKYIGLTSNGAEMWSLPTWRREASRLLRRQLSGDEACQSFLISAKRPRDLEYVKSLATRRIVNWQVQEYSPLSLRREDRQGLYETLRR